MAKKVNQYISDFLRDVMKEKYKSGEVTPEIYQKEVLKFMKSKMDGETLLNDVINFLNQTANDIVETPSFNGMNPLSSDKNLFPNDFLKGLVVNSSLPTKKVKDIISSKVTAQEYVDFCNKFDTKGEKSVSNRIENCMNKFKYIEACKPTGNSFTRFFKKMFNIGGYNDKMAAYNNAKASLKELVGNRLSDEDFEKHIKSDERFSSSFLIKQEEPLKEKINVKEVLIEKDEPEVKIEKDKEQVNEINIEIDNSK